MSEINRGDAIHGSLSGIGTTAVPLSTSRASGTKGVLIKAANANTGTVYVGTSANVTAGTVDVTDGFELAAGESLSVEVDTVTELYVIGSASGQKVFWMAA